MQRKCNQLQLAQKPSNLHPAQYLLILSAKSQKPSVNIMYQQQRHDMQVTTFFFSEKYYQQFVLSILIAIGLYSSSNYRVSKTICL